MRGARFRGSEGRNIQLCSLFNVTLYHTLKPVTNYGILFAILQPSQA